MPKLIASSTPGWSGVGAPSRFASAVADSFGCRCDGESMSRVFVGTLALGIFGVAFSLACAARSSAQEVTVPASTPIPVQLRQHVPMKAGQVLDGKTLYPVYVDNRMAIPAGSELRGSVVRLKPDRTSRIHSRLRGDFTPFHIPVVRFDTLILPDGTSESIHSEDATDGAPVLHLSTPAGKKNKGSFVSEQIAQAKANFKDQAALVTAPGRGDRLVQFLYTQLPYHPERIQTGTAWTVELTEPLQVPPPAPPKSLPNSPPNSDDPSPGKSSQDIAGHASEPGKSTGDQPHDAETVWRLRAYLDRTLSSKDEKPGDTFQAVVAEPVFDADHTIAVPEGAILVGTVTQAKRARSFGRKGKLRFNFRELKFPAGTQENVEGNLAGADTNAAADLQIDSEGGVQPKQQNRVIVPLVLTLLASRALDTDGSQAGNATVASNGFGIVGRIVGIAATSRNLSAGIGFYGAGLSFYDRWLTRGRDVVFAKNTRIEVATRPSRRQVVVPQLKNTTRPAAP
jgi:hypothetical protein